MTAAPAPRAAEVRPGDAPVAGPLAAAVVDLDRWRGTPGWHVLYADLDLAERAGTARALGLGPDADDLAIARGALARWGADAPARLGGGFAVAAWDGERQRVVAARDAVGVRPLVYAAGPRRLVVGGDVRAVLAAGVDDALDEDVLVALFLDVGFDAAGVGRTGFRAVDALRGGDRLAWDGAAAVDAWWDPLDVPAVPLRRVDEVGAALRAVLREVSADLTAGVRAGVHLSPGIDSAHVAAFAAEAVGPVPAFSWQWPPDGEPAPEHRRALAVAERWGLPLHWCPVSVADYLAVYERDPLREPTKMWAPEAPVRRAAAAAGVEVLLTGWGGDEGVSSSGRGRVPPHLARGPRSPPAALWARARTAVRALRAPRRILHIPTLASLRDAALAGDLISHVRPEALRRAALPEPAPPPPDLAGHFAWLWRRGHVGVRAEAWNRAGAPLGLRYRFPLLDRRVLAFVMGLPPEAWLGHDGLRRWPLRAAGAGLVPDATRLHGGKAEPEWQRASQATRREAAARLAPHVAAAAGPLDAVLDRDALGRELAAWLAEGGPPGGPSRGLHPLRYLPVPPGTFVHPPY